MHLKNAGMSLRGRKSIFAFSRQLSVVRLVRIAFECHFGVIQAVNGVKNES